MKAKWLVSILCVALAGSLALAAEKPADDKAAAEQQAMMEAYIKAATPGPEHQEMAKMVGTWQLDVSSWMAPDAPPEKSTGTATFEMILGGRYLQQTVKSEMGGQAFEGVGFEGYDNTSKERFGLWMDTMGTGGLISKGKCAVGAKTCTMNATMHDPLTGKLNKYREVVTKTNDDSFTFDMYGPDPKTGKEYKMMTIVYTRG